LFIQV